MKNIIIILCLVLPIIAFGKTYKITQPGNPNFILVERNSGDKITIKTCFKSDNISCKKIGASDSQSYATLNLMKQMDYFNVGRAVVADGAIALMVGGITVGTGGAGGAVLLSGAGSYFLIDIINKRTNNKLNPVAWYKQGQALGTLLCGHDQTVGDIDAFAKQIEAVVGKGYESWKVEPKS